eukprot:765759-Hanusia_phi.AAC.7
MLYWRGTLNERRLGRRGHRRWSESARQRSAGLHQLAPGANLCETGPVQGSKSHPDSASERDEKLLLSKVTPIARLWLQSRRCARMRIMMGTTWRERKLPHSSGMHRSLATGICQPADHLLQQRRVDLPAGNAFLSGIFLIDIVLFKNRKAVVAVEVSENDGGAALLRMSTGRWPHALQSSGRGRFCPLRAVHCPSAAESRWKDKILRQEGLTVISIPFYEWDSLLAEGKKDQQQAYLLAKLEAAGVKLEELDRLPQPSDTAATSS